MATYSFDLYPANDPAGKASLTGTAARLARLTIGDQLVDGWYKHDGFGLSEGSISIHGDHADAVHLHKRVYVMFVRTDGTEQQIGGFWLEEGDFDALSRQEQGGRILTFGGPGGLFMLDRYRLGHSVYATGQPNRGDWNVPDQWTWSQEPYGAVLVRGIEEGRDHPDAFFAPLTVDFTRTRDSNNLLWTELEDYNVPIGTSILEMYADFLSLGLVVQCSADLVVSAYRDIDEFSTDRTSATFAAGKVRFAAGVNIANELTRRIAAKQERTHVLYRDRIGDYQTITTGGSGEPYMDYRTSDTTADDAAIVRMGTEFLTRKALYVDQATVIHIIGDGVGQYAPGPAGDYWVLDLVSLHTGTGEYDFDNQSIEVASILFHFDEAGNPLVSTQLGAQHLDAQREAFQSLASSIRNTPTLQLCHDAPGGVGDETFTRTETDQWGLSEFDGEPWYTAAPGITALPSLRVDGTHGILSTNEDDSAFANWVLGASTYPIELLIKFKLLSGTHALYDGVGGTASFEVLVAADDGNDYFWLEVLSNIGPSDQDDIWLELNRRVGGAVATTDQVVDHITGGAGIDQWLWMRLYGDATEAKAKVWLDGTSEPGTWATTVANGTQSVSELEGLSVQWYNAAGAGTIGAGNFEDAVQIESMEWISGVAGGTDSCIHGGPAASSGADEACNKCAAPGNHEHDYVAAGGTTGQVLKKASATDWDTAWDTLPAAGAPTDATYLVTTAHASLPAEVAVGATPGGELGGAWAAPTVDTTHSGSSHAGVVTAHEEASDPHTGYVREADANWVDLTDAGATTLHTHAGGAHTHVVSEVPAGTVDGANDTFTVAATPTAGTLRLHKNGLRQKAGAGNDYTLATATITFLAGNLPQTGDTLLADYET